MIRRITATAAAVFLVGACGGSSGSTEREVLVDFSPDEVATFVAQNFPKKVEIEAGQTVVFKQTWTGEPHTITGGSTMNAQLKAGSKWIDFFNNYGLLYEGNPNLPNPEDPGDAVFAEMGRALAKAKPRATAMLVRNAYVSLAQANPALPPIDSTMPFAEALPIIEREADAAFESLKFAADDDFNINQNIGQSCYLDRGDPPEDENTPCSDAQQEQPVFDGTHRFYNSGILPYEGPRGNTYKVDFAENTKPGTYYFYCAIHGPGQLSAITVRKPGTEVPSASTVARTARDEALAATKGMQKTFRDATRTNKVEVDGEMVEGPFAGLPIEIHGMINEFVPRTLRAKVNEPITWKVIGGDHTISFDVPPYLPIVEFTGDRIRFNEKVREPVGGAPARPEPGEGPDGESGGPPGGDGPPPEPETVDGGTWDGSGFWSTGVVGGDPYLNYTLRISKKGTYPYACLIHPKMIGRVVVE